MSDFVIFAIFFAALAVLNLIRVALGPTPADRQVAGDNADILITVALVLFSLIVLLLERRREHPAEKLYGNRVKDAEKEEKPAEDTKKEEA